MRDLVYQFEENAKKFKQGQHVIPDNKDPEKRMKRRKSDLRLKRLMK